jgi:hypothetical protein
MIEPVREVPLPYPCDFIREGETQSQESGFAGVQELQEFRSCRSPGVRSPGRKAALILQLLNSCNS